MHAKHEELSLHREVSIDKSERKPAESASKRFVHFFDPCRSDDTIECDKNSKKFFLNVTLYPSKSKSNERINNAIFRASIK